MTLGQKGHESSVLFASSLSKMSQWSYSWLKSLVFWVYLEIEFVKKSCKMDCLHDRLYWIFENNDQS
jgi:hypothetical protein